MTDIYLVRHGQAGDRESYDSLSELGRRQSRLLGEYFVSQEIKFAAAYTGGQLRQRQTAVEVSAAYADAGVAFPGVTVDNGWNEFDLDQIYREMAPQLCAEDSEFRREYESMREQLRASAGIHEARVHRRCHLATRKWSRHGFAAGIPIRARRGRGSGSAWRRASCRHQR